MGIEARLYPPIAVGLPFIKNGTDETKLFLILRLHVTRLSGTMWPVKPLCQTRTGDLQGVRYTLHRESPSSGNGEREISIFRSQCR